MGRDFAKKGRHASRAKAQPAGHWLWLLIGLIIGIIISIAAVYKLSPLIVPTLAKFESATIAPTQTPAAKSAQEPSPERAPRFDFYSLLPELEVKIPAKETPPENETVTAPVEMASESGYRLQLGSFRKYEDADRLKAQMAMIGIQVEVESVTLATNDIWYRVRSNPYPDRKTAEAVRSQLQAQAIDSLLLEEQG